MAAEGHEIGVHTWAHANMTHLQVSGLTAQMQQEVIDTENLIFNLTGRWADASQCQTNRMCVFL